MRETDRQTVRQTDRQIDCQTVRQRETERKKKCGRTEGVRWRQKGTGYEAIKKQKRGSQSTWQHLTEAGRVFGT